jgi:hypothetical protein
LTTTILIILFIIAPIILRRVAHRNYLKRVSLYWGFGLYLLVLLVP